MKTARHEAQKFLQELLSYEGDECLMWPYMVGSDGVGRMWFKGKPRRVPRVICEAAHGPPPTPDHEAAHSCGKGHLACVTKGHLSWKTHVENIADKFIHGTIAKGERQGSAKLTEADVRTILALKGIVAQRRIAARFGV